MSSPRPAGAICSNFLFKTSTFLNTFGPRSTCSRLYLFFNNLKAIFSLYLFWICLADVPEVPTKCVTSIRRVNVQAQVQFIDFEGRSDGESLLKILSQLRPRRVIVVRGSPASTKAIEEHCRVNVGARVFTPAKGEIVDATTETHIYQVSNHSPNTQIIG